MTLRKLRGAGGGGGSSSSSTAQETPDSLQSRQIVHIIDLISEGEIEGVVSDASELEGLYLDGTVVRNPDHSLNFQGVSLTTRNGTQNQSYIPGFPAVENEVTVSTQVKQATPVTRNISNSDVDAVRVTIFVPRLTSYASGNNLVGTSVQIAIDVQTAGGGYVQKVLDTIRGKTTGKYQRAYRIELDGAGPWDIRVRRTTADSTNQNLSNDTWWGSYTEIIDAKLRYPNCALAAIKFDAQNFGSIPTRGYRVKGIKCKVPYNYDPITRTYNGVWDGTFLTKWTDNPAWIFYDLITARRYGLGEFIDEALLDKWNLYQIAQYCDELVPDGNGGYEPRFTCNIFLQTREEAYKVVQNFASVFRGIVYWGSGGIVPSPDMPADPTMVFTNANVVDGMFEYSGTDKSARHTVALVTWNDKNNQSKQTIEYVEHPTGIELYGVNETEVVAFGCNSKGQAHRFGKAILNSEVNDTETVTFQCGLDGTYVYPGCVFEIADRYRHGKRVGGRVAAASGTVITLDSSVEYFDVETYTLTCVLPNGNVETRVVLGYSDTGREVTIASPFTNDPLPMSQWVMVAGSDVKELWRATTLAEGDKPGHLRITGMSYRPEKYAQIENNLEFQPVTAGSFNIPRAPENLTISEDMYQVGTEVKTQVNLSWDGVPGLQWDVLWKNNDGNWQATARLKVPSVTVYDVDVGSFDVKVTAVDALGQRSQETVGGRLIIGKTAPPVAVEGFTMNKIGGVGVAEWISHADIDVRVGGKIVIRHAQETVGATWSNSAIVAAFDGNMTHGNVALMTGTYMAKARDSSGNWSENHVSFVVTEGMDVAYTTVDNITEHPTFTGAKTNLEVDGITLRIAGTALSGEYEFSDYVDLGTVATRRFEADLGILGFLADDSIDARGDIDSWDDIDGGTINDTDVTLFARTTNDDPSGTPTWSDWAPFFVADFTCRAIQFKLLLERGVVTVNTAVSTLLVDIKVPT